MVHFHNGTGGGVLSVIRNLLAYRQHPEIENHVIFTINREQMPNYKAPGLEGAASEQIFYYSPKWNFYYTCRQLAKLLPDDKAVIVAHDWLELGMVSNLGLRNPVVQFVHGDYEYYYRLAERHESSVDHFICIARTIKEQLNARLPLRSAAIHNLRFPVPEIIPEKVKATGFHIVFAGRCETAKGYDLLPLIDENLSNDAKNIQWHIAGPGSDTEEQQKIWKSGNVTFHGNLAQRELQAVLKTAHVFVLPSLAEGMPVSVVEAMKAGVVPVVNDLKGGLQELVEEGVTGYRIPNNEPALFAERLAMLLADDDLRHKIAVAAAAYANTYFSPNENTLQIEAVFLNAALNIKIKKSQKIYGSRLDHPAIPNLIVKTIRSFA